MLDPPGSAPLAPQAEPHAVRPSQPAPPRPLRHLEGCEAPGLAADANRGSGFWLAVALTVPAAVLTLLVEWHAPMKDDVAWLLHVAQSWLAGGEPYVTEIEINPPPIIWLSAGAVLVSRFVGASVLTAYPVLVLLLLALCAGWAASVLRRRGAVADAAPAFMAAFLVLLVVSAGEFGQREHLIAALALPYLAYRVHGRGAGSVSAAEGVAAGVLVGICCALKPHYVLAFLAVEAGMALRGRGIAWAPMAGATLSGTAAAGVALVVHPAYAAEVVPLALDLYRVAFDLRRAFPPGAVLWGSALVAGWWLWWASRTPRDGDLALVLLLFSLGAGIVFVLQSRGFAYQRIPATAMTALALIALIAACPRRVAVRASAAVLLLALVGQGGARFVPRVAIASGAAPALTHQIADALRHHGATSYMAFSSTLGTGFPVVYLANVPWTSRFPSMWAVRAELAAEARRQGGTPVSSSGRRWVVMDFLAACPDLVLVDSADGVQYPLALSRFDQHFALAWAAYVRIEGPDGVELFRRPREAPSCLPDTVLAGRASAGARR